MALLKDTDPTAERAVAVFGELAPEAATPPWETVGDVAPGLAGFIQQGLGGLLGAPGLDLRTRQLVTVALLTALGGAETQLAFHVGGALRAGAGAGEIVEAIAQTALYAGVPRSLNGLAVARAVLAEQSAVSA